jgi:transposase, IS30 family
MQPYHHFTLTERQNLHDKLAEKKNLRTIAKEMNRNVSSVSRELARNRNKDGTYNAWRGCCLYIIRRQKSRRQYRIQTDTPLYKWILAQMDIFYPPETIVATWKQNNPGEKLSHNTIYRAVKELRITGIEPKIHLRRHGQGKRRTKQRPSIQKTI